MTFKSGANAPLGFPGIGVTGDTEMKVPVGTITTMYDDIQGQGEFIYLPGLAGLAMNDAVIFDLMPGAQAITRLTNAVGSNTGRPIAIAQGAWGVNTWGWYQIGGVAIVNALAGAVAGPVFANASVGFLASAADAGDQILGARFSSPVGTPLAGKAYAMLSRPFIQGQIT